MRAEVRERIEMIERGGVPKGYRQINDEIFPEEWELASDFITIESGYGFKQEEYSGQGIPLIKINNINYGAMDYSDTEFLPIEYKNHYESFLLKKGDVLLALNRPITQKKLKISKLDIDEAILYQRVGKLIFNNGYCSDYYYQYLQSSKFVNQLESLLVGSDQPYIKNTEFKNIKFLKPSLSEQNRISVILSTWDRTIDLKEKLLEQQKLQKKGLMERLLTGKVRLPEFSEEWNMIRISKLLAMCERPIKLDDDSQYEQITIRRNYGGIESRGNSAGKSILVTTQFLVCQNDFVISRRQIAHGACGVVPIELDGAIVSNEYDVFTGNEGLDVHFFSYLMQLPIFKYKFYVFSNGVHIEKMIFHTKTWLKSEIKLPIYEEQVKIREVLDKGQMAIDLLNQEIEKLKAQKKGLMQLLLTGKVRVSC